MPTGFCYDNIDPCTSECKEKLTERVNFMKKRIVAVAVSAMIILSNINAVPFAYAGDVEISVLWRRCQPLRQTITA